MRINNDTVKAAEEYVRRIFREEFSEGYTFHSIEHVEAVCNAVDKLASEMEVSESEHFALKLAALFHDIGYAREREDHERLSANEAAAFLENQHVDREDIELVRRLIMATYPPHDPTDRLEALIRDADLAHLGNEDYLDVLNKLRDEWEQIANVKYKNVGWFKMNLDFLSSHNYYTEEAKKLFPHKSSNLETIARVTEALVDMRKKKKKKKKKKSKSDGTKPNPMSSRPAQMMFKTSLRNHIDLTNIADNKANIMLSINAIIVTIMIPLVANNLAYNAKMIIPIIFLFSTCIISIIFAALVTRPIKMSGMTTVEQIKQGKSNLFFFGNFYKLSLDQYESGMDRILTNDDHLNNAILRDLYFLGRSLGKKYNRLRICYLVFIIGMSTTVLSFGISQIIFA